MEIYLIFFGGKREMKKIIITLGSLLLISLVMTACQPAPSQSEPITIVETVVVEKEGETVVETVVVEKEVVVEPKQDELYAELRVKKRELVEKVRLGDKQQRMAAITELAGFSFDLKVRLALENVVRSNPDAELRIAAVRAFASVRNKDALPLLKKVRVTDPSETVRAEITQDKGRVAHEFREIFGDLHIMVL